MNDTLRFNVLRSQDKGHLIAYLQDLLSDERDRLINETATEYQRGRVNALSDVVESLSGRK